MEPETWQNNLIKHFHFVQDLFAGKIKIEILHHQMESFLFIVCYFKAAFYYTYSLLRIGWKMISLLRSN